MKRRQAIGILASVGAFFSSALKAFGFSKQTDLMKATDFVRQTIEDRLRGPSRVEEYRNDPSELAARFPMKRCFHQDFLVSFTDVKSGGWPTRQLEQFTGWFADDNIFGANPSLARFNEKPENAYLSRSGRCAVLGIRSEDSFSGKEYMSFHVVSGPEVKK